MSAFSRLGNALDTFSDTLSRSNQLRDLYALSDRELAKKGLRRDQIVNYFYRDIRYL